MKKVLWVLLAVAMLAGCGAGSTTNPITMKQTVTPEYSAILTPAASAVMTENSTITESPPSSLNLSTQPPSSLPSDSEQNTPTPMQAPDFTNTPYQDAPLISSPFPPMKSNKANQALGIGIVTIQKGDLVYYTQIDQDRPYEGSTIYKLDLNTGKVTSLREAKTVITQIFVDAKGTLYYARYKKNEEWYSSLYQYNKNGDILLADRISGVVRVDEDNIYCITDYYISNQNGTLIYDNSWTLIDKFNLKARVSYRIAVIHGGMESAWFVDSRPLMLFVSYDNPKTYSLDLENGTIRKVSDKNENYMTSCDGDCLVKYEQENGKTRFTIFNYRTMKNVSCISPIKASKLYLPYVVNNRLYIITDNETEGSWDITKSTIFEVDLRNGALLSTTELDYVSEACVYQGKWYLYTFQMKDDKEGMSHMIGQKVRIYDPNTKRYSTIASFGNRMIGDDKEFLFEVCGGYVWMILISGCEGASYDWWKRFPIPNAHLSATPSPFPTPSPSSTLEPTTTPPATIEPEITTPTETDEAA